MNFVDKKKMMDYLIVGSGLYGMVIARELTDLGYTVKVIDKRSHLGGNIYNEKIEGIMCINMVRIFSTRVMSVCGGM